MPNPKDIAYSEAVHAEKQRLLGLGDAELRALPGYSAVAVIVAGVEVSVGIWHQSHGEGFEVFVAQARRPFLLVCGFMFVEGFILGHDGSRDALPDKVFYEYA